MKHKIKVKIKQGKSMQTASVKKGEKKHWHLRNVGYMPKTVLGSLHLLFLIIRVTLRTRAYQIPFYREGN